MNRSEFFHRSTQLACGVCAALVLGKNSATAAEATSSPAATPVDEALKRAKYENAFTNNWLTDLFDTIDAEVDPATKLKLMEGCGRGCFRRHKFKTDIAEAGKGDLEKLLAAYEKSFLIWRETGTVHIAYGSGSNGCFCPAARNRPARPNDLHCECTRATHEAIFETALGRPFKIELAETVRRGGNRCHLVVHLS
ncbi:hypothetical protein DB347_04615 [Opitutaceae bacterium EW11]|nr:hypothetical protein DB347_04615 [Opitutaceae bacterium EW11]